MKASKVIIHYGWIIFPLVMVVLGSSVMYILVTTTQHIEDDSNDILRALRANVHQRLRLLVEANDLAINVASVFSSIKGLSQFSDIRREVVPRLFLAFMALPPWVSEISYVSPLDGGLLLSYYYHDKGGGAIAAFSNGSLYCNDSTTAASYQLYSRSLNQSTGEVFGDVIPFTQPCSERQWLQDALNGKGTGGGGNASWGVGWGKSKEYGGEMMLFFTAPAAKTGGGGGVISVGITVKHFFNDIFSSIDLQGGLMYVVGTIDDDDDGHILTQSGPRHTRYRYHDKNKIISVHVGNYNKSQADDDQDQYAATISCGPTHHGGDHAGRYGAHDHLSNAATNYLSISGTEYKFGCEELSIYGARLVSVVAFASNRSTVATIRSMRLIILQLESFMFLVVIIGSYIILRLFRRSLVRETLLRASLIKQKEKIQLAERISTKKSLAFASANHDVRNSLAGLTGLIELCHADAPQNSALDKHLEQMNICASNLLEILNTILDTSKVEAGKMQLEEVEFDMAQLIEESADMFHIVALKKGLEVIWDPCDCSILRLSKVKGDCRRLKQILHNLLGNAVKFTNEGQVVVRAWAAKKPSFENLKPSRIHGYHHFANILGCLSRRFSKDRDAEKDLETLNSIKHDRDSVEFIFEIDDTGIGIPREKRASVFESYVQVNESAVGGHEGTGLGLGIVQSCVRLMGGEINIQDKERGERGTCFRFNIFLKSNDHRVFDGEGEDRNIVGNNGIFAAGIQRTEKNITVQSNIRAMTFRRSLKIEGIHSLLLVQGDGTRRILQRWMEGLGIKVWTILQRELLHPTLEKIKHNLSSSKEFDSISLGISLDKTTSRIYSTEKEVNLSVKEEADQILPIATKKDHNQTSVRGSSTYVVAIIDSSYGNIPEMCSILKNFTSSIGNIQCKIVWLASSETPSTELRISKETQTICDLLLEKPIHGSRLYALLKLLQEFGGTNEGSPSEMHDVNMNVQESTNSVSFIDRDRVPFKSLDPQSSENFNQSSEMRYNGDDKKKPLTGMNILLVEDTSVLRQVTTFILSGLGATIESSANGLDALYLIRKALQAYSVNPKHFHYDLVLMDCEMPKMNGYDATKHIREEEKNYGLHIPIIALTGHATPEEEKKTTLSGMDLHLTKPLQSDKLLNAIKTVQQNLSNEILCSYYP